MPKLNEFLFGGKDKIKKAGTQTPLQEELMALISEGLTKGTGAFKELFGSFDQKGFEEGVSKPALKMFEEDILPKLTHQFINSGSVQGSSFNKARLKAGTDLQSKLAQLMYQAQEQQKQNQLAGVNTALGTKSFENIYQQGNTGAVQGFAQGAGQGIGQIAGAGIPGVASSATNLIKSAVAG
jgi:hypothetical protein